MRKFHSLEKPVDQVRICKGNTCIEAKGDNAKLITLGCVFVLLCVGVAVLSRK